MAHSHPSNSSSAPLLSHSPSPHDAVLDRERHHRDDEHEDVDEDDLEALSISSGVQTPPPAYLEKHTRQGRRSSSLHAAARRPRVLAIAAILIFLVAFAVFAVVHVSRGEGTFWRVPELNLSDTTLSVTGHGKESLYPAQVLGAPTESFRDNLREDTQYITAWINAGWTNDFMTYANLLYMAILSNRTAVLPPFAPSHVGSAAGFVAVGEVFDIARLSSALPIPIIEWSDIKANGSEHDDDLGCWSIWATASPEHQPRYSSVCSYTRLDVSYTPVPDSALMLPRPQFANEPHTRFSSLAALTYPNGRERAHLPAAAPFPALTSGRTSLPDEQMACFDFPYYVGAADIFEFYDDWSPAWRFAGTHAHWTSRMEGLAIEALRQTFSTEEGAATPPYISMHVRHGDFGHYCQTDGCFAPLSAYARRVDEVRAELRERKGIEVERVVVTSDEHDPAWWASVSEMGWERVDHTELRTEERFGRWYPVLLDAVVQSLGAGFVGTDRSTMTLIAQRRVEDWNGGPTRIVKWGSEDADAHKRGLYESVFSESARAKRHRVKRALSWDMKYEEGRKGGRDGEEIMTPLTDRLAI